MSHTLTKAALVLLGGAIAACVLYALTVRDIAIAGAPTGVAASTENATSSALSLSAATATTILATSTQCSARIISTKASAILLTFTDYAGQAPTALYGHVQPASTTVAYDSGIYGCGRVRAYSMAADIITVTETR